MASSGPPPDDVESLARWFDETMGRARQHLAAMRLAGDELASLKKRPARSHDRVIDDLLEDLGTG